MANHYRGEVTVSIAGRAYTLRPSFHILCQLEERIGLALPELLRRITHKGLLASEILMVLAIASRHDGSQPVDSAVLMDMPADTVDLQALLPDISRFLMQALLLEDNKGLSYGDLLELAYRVLRIEPAAFWNLTPPELRLLLRAVRPAQTQPVFPQKEEMQDMLRRFPDAVAQ